MAVPYKIKYMNLPLRSALCVPALMAAVALCSPQTAEEKQQEFSSHIQKAQSYLHERRPDLAIPELAAATAIDPENVEAQGNLGVLLYFQGKLAEAIPHLRVAVEKQPSLSKIQGVLGIAELRTHDAAQGRKDLELSFPLIPDQKFKVQVGLELAGIYTQSGDLEQAASMLEQLKKVAPDNSEVLYAAYRTYSDLSMESMLALSLSAPDSAQMHQLIAHEESKEGNTNGAIAQYRKAIAIDQHLPGVHFELAELLHTAQDPGAKNEAEREYRAALIENPQDEKAVCRLADFAAEKGDMQQAMQEYSKAIELQPSDADAKLGLAKILLGLDQTDKALPLLEETVRLEPTNPIAHYRLGTLYRKLGRTDDAKREVETYKQLKDLKDKMRAVYKDLLIQPDEIRAEAQDEK